MSATGRGTERRKADFYATPFPAFNPLIPYLDKSLEQFDPAAGDGRLVVWSRKFGLTADGCDLYAPTKAFDQGLFTVRDGVDFLEDDTDREAIVTNPPFSLAQEFVAHALVHSKETFMLLRLNFLASKKRRDFWRVTQPNAILVLSERPSFTDDGKTDACDYCWMYWGRRHFGTHFL